MSNGVEWVSLQELSEVGSAVVSQESGFGLDMACSVAILEGHQSMRWTQCA